MTARPSETSVTLFPKFEDVRHADKLAIIAPGTFRETTTFGMLEERSRRFAHVLRSLGVSRGDTIAILAENDPRYFEAYWAALRSGLYVVAIDRHLVESEVEFILRDSQACALILSSSLTHLVPADLSEAIRATYEFGDSESTYEVALASASNDELNDEPAGSTMLYTSGTTGRPKGVRPVLPERQVYDGGDYLVNAFAPRFGFDSDSIFFTPAPLHHAAPLRLAAMVQALGGTVIISTRFDAELCLASIDRFAVTHSLWVPTHFVRLLKLPDEVKAKYSTASMKVALHVAAPCPPAVKLKMIEMWGLIVDEYYGSTESIGLTAISAAEWLERPSSVGRSILGVPHVCGPDGSPLPSGSDGVIYFERETQTFAYFGDEARTRRAVHPSHPTWMTVFDVGHLDEDGYLYLVGRDDDLIISGGVNIGPSEVEGALILSDLVVDLGVVGIPDDEFGERVCALIKLRPGVPATDDTRKELLAYAKRVLAGPKLPRTIVFVDSVPRTSTGKLKLQSARIVAKDAALSR